MIMLTSSIWEGGQLQRVVDGFRKTYFFTFLQLDLEQLVDSFFVIEGVHDGEVDGSAKVDQIRACFILDTLLVRNDCGRGLDASTLSKLMRRTLVVVRLFVARIRIGTALLI